jgi:hypothetical protein
MRPLFKIEKPSAIKDMIKKGYVELNCVSPPI